MQRAHYTGWGFLLLRPGFARRAIALGAERIYLQTLDLSDLDHLRLVAAEVMPHV